MSSIFFPDPSIGANPCAHESPRNGNIGSLKRTGLGHAASKQKEKNGGLHVCVVQWYRLFHEALSESAANRLDARGVTNSCGKASNYSLRDYNHGS
jgi:hypothetical protein